MTARKSTAKPVAEPVAEPVADPLAELRASVNAAGSMEQMALALGVNGKSTFRPWVRSHIGHFGTNTTAMRAAAVVVADKGHGIEIGTNAVDAVLARFGPAPTAPTAPSA